jgi:hydroxymethylpyrimidine/phosphomethylpyrimidine kinase
MSLLPVVLSIAGSDSSAGAGAQADLKTLSAMGVYGVTALTCVVAEVPGMVKAIEPVAPAIVSAQIRLLFESFPIAALKTGLLCSVPIIECVCDTLETLFANAPRRPFLVVDPVMIATAGTALLEPDAVLFYKERLFPLAGLVTPNLDELAVLVGRPIENLDEMRDAGQQLVAQHRTAFLLKGAHLRQSLAIDLLITPSGEVSEFSAPFIPGISTHGTGCTLSAAIAAGLARGSALQDAVGDAKTFVSRAIAQFLRWEQSGRQVDALHHFASPM